MLKSAVKKKLTNLNILQMTDCYNQQLNSIHKKWHTKFLTGSKYLCDLLEDGGGHHLRLRRGLHNRLPCICRLWHNKTKFEVPLLKTPTLEQNLLLQTELLNLLLGTKIKLSRYCTTFEDVLRYASLMLHVWVAQVLGILPENLAPVGVPQADPIAETSVKCR